MSTTTTRPETLAGPTVFERSTLSLDVIKSGVEASGLTSGVMHYDRVKHLLVNRPLHRQAIRPLPPAAVTAEDAEDIADARRVLADPAEGRVSLDDLRRELGF